MQKVLFAFLAIIVLQGCTGRNDDEHLDFSHEQWLQGDWRIRGKMVNSIIDDSILFGKSKPEVINLLGEPTAGDTIGLIVYVVDIGKKVGPFGMGGTSPFYMTVQFDSVTNKVSDVWCRD
jgi:hypothetical protein